MNADQLAAILQAYRIRFYSELHLQDGIAQALTQESIPFEREKQLTPKDRIDFLVGGIGVEIKIESASASVLRQLHRYAQHDLIRELLLVTSRAKHLSIPRRMNGK